MSKPKLLRTNPETDDVVSPFAELYGQAKRHFCYRILKDPFSDSPWQSVMRPSWSPNEYNPVEYGQRMSKMVQRVWNEIKPAPQQTHDFIDADRSLMDVHNRLTSAFGVSQQSLPEEVALANLQLWTNKGLRHFWNNRCSGKQCALFSVQSSSVEMKGMVPHPVMDVYVSGSRDVPYTYR